VLALLERGAVRIARVDDADVPRIRELVAGDQSRRMDLTDATLVRGAERDGIDTVLTVDRRRFQAYRIGKRKAFRIVPLG